MKPMKYALAALACALAIPAFAHDGVHVDGAYARVMPGAKTGAVFMAIENHATSEEKLLAITTDAAERAELHTHKTGEDGVMQMLKIEDGIVIPAGQIHELARGGDHVMLMGLTRDLKDGDTIAMTLTFEHAGEMTVEVPVDNAE